MKINAYAPNQTEITTEKARILVSYSTPVCAYVFGRGWIKTDKFYSKTTSKHINAFGGANAETVPQSEINALLPG
jgi:hypothetical protein